MRNLALHTEMYVDTRLSALKSTLIIYPHCWSTKQNHIIKHLMDTLKIHLFTITKKLNYWSRCCTPYVILVKEKRRGEMMIAEERREPPCPCCWLQGHLLFQHQPTQQPTALLNSWIIHKHSVHWGDMHPVWVYVCILVLSACLYFNVNAYMCLWKLSVIVCTQVCVHTSFRVWMLCK